MDFATSERYPHDPKVINLSEIAALLKEAGLPNVSVEQTGGGVATLYAGNLRTENEMEFYDLAVGPGWFEPHWLAPNAQAFIVIGGSFYGQDSQSGDNIFDTAGDARAIVRQCLDYLQKNAKP
jgi:hypothetical protein